MNAELAENKYTQALAYMAPYMNHSKWESTHLLKKNLDKQ
jgi:hypothetical protein